MAGSNTVAASVRAKHAGTYGLRSTFDGTNTSANAQIDLAAASSDLTVEFYVRLSPGFEKIKTNIAVKMRKCSWQ